MATTFDWKNFDRNGLRFGKPSDYQTGGGSTVPITYADPRTGTEGKITMQTPRMTAPFGVSSFKGKGVEDRASVSMSLSFKGQEQDARIQKFYEFFEDLDAVVLEAACTNRTTWFKKTHNKKTKQLEPPTNEMIAAMWTDSIKMPTKEEYKECAPTVKSKVPVRYDQIMTQFYDNNKELIASNDVPKGGEVVCLWDLTGVWQVQGRFGLSWSCVQVKSYGGGVPQGYAMRTESDDESTDPSPAKRSKTEDPPSEDD